MGFNLFVQNLTPGDAMNLVKKIKNHVRNHKGAYIAGTIGAVAGVLIVSRGLSYKSGTTTNVKLEGINHIIPITDEMEKIMEQGGYFLFDGNDQPDKFVVMTGNLLEDFMNKRWHEKMGV